MSGVKLTPAQLRCNKAQEIIKVLKENGYFTFRKEENFDPQTKKQISQKQVLVKGLLCVSFDLFNGKMGLFQAHDSTPILQESGSLLDQDPLVSLALIDEHFRFLQEDLKAMQNQQRQSQARAIRQANHKNINKRR